MILKRCQIFQLPIWWDESLNFLLYKIIFCKLHLNLNKNIALSWTSSRAQLHLNNIHKMTWADSIIKVQDFKYVTIQLYKNEEMCISMYHTNKMENFLKNKIIYTHVSNSIMHTGRIYFNIQHWIFNTTKLLITIFSEIIYTFAPNSMMPNIFNYTTTNIQYSPKINK